VPDEPSSSADFGRLYRATLLPLRRYLTRLLGNTAEAQDVAHDAYLRIYPQKGKPPADKPEALLYTTARNLAFNRLKRRSISPIAPSAANYETTATSTPGVAQEVMARQERDMLEKAISELPQGCRSVLLLRKVERLSHHEIADRLGIAISTVEKQHARALRLLRASLENQMDRGSHPACSATENRAGP
jgi:RNA polymerase sigma-70 factor (ECF subfamily)